MCIAYQNKDVLSKSLAENFKNKSLRVYGLDLPKIVQVLPTNLPIVEANELRIDNLFLLEDGTVAIIDYESKYKAENKVKYLNYISRVLERYKKEGNLNVKIRMIVIYTADVTPDQAEDVFDVGSLRLEVESAFLSKLDSQEIMSRLTDKVRAKQPLTDEEMMEFIILPLTYKGKESKKENLKHTIELAKDIADESTSVFVLSGILVFSDKIMDEELPNQVKEWIKMTKIAKLFEQEKEIALAEKDAALAEKDAALAKEKAKNAEKDAVIAQLKAQLTARN